jgi:hypothetical protein
MFELENNLHRLREEAERMKDVVKDDPEESFRETAAKFRI